MYATRAPTALLAFARDALHYRSLNATYEAFLRTKDHNKLTGEKFSFMYQCNMPDETQQLQVFDDVPLTRAEFTKMLELESDVERMTQPFLYTLAFGGLPLLALPFWTNAIHRLPSQFFNTAEEAKEAALARELEFHIKFAPTAAHAQTRLLEFFLNGDARHNEAFDSIANGFTATKDPVKIRKMGQAIAKQGTCSLRFTTADVSSFLREMEHLTTSAFLGKPMLWHNTYSLSARLVSYYRGLFQEDLLIKKDGLSSIETEELYKICHRRLIARVEENLERADLEARLNDWFTPTEIKEGEELVPLRVVIAYQASHFRDPGFLEESLESLDKEAFPTGFTWARDTFERRVAFETGPLAEHVKAHLENVAEREAKMLEDRKAYLEGKATAA